MRKSKVFLNNWVIYLMAFCGTIVFLIFPPVIVWLIIYSRSLGNETATMGAIIGVTIVALIAMPIAPLIIWKLFIQWTIIDEENIKTRNIYKVIRELKWSQVEEVSIMKLILSSPGSGLKWIVFFEKDKEKKLVNGIVNTNTLITIRYTKKNKEWLKQYWDKPIEKMNY
ncbi:MAG: hypothetical protein ABIJ40_14000 [Bacteroidota bacterium]